MPDWWWALAAALAAAVIYIRMAPFDPAHWHVDPLRETFAKRSNRVLALPAGAGPADIHSMVFNTPPEALADRIDRIALSEPRTRRIAGGPDKGWTTYVQRSAFFGFPDFISVRVAPNQGGGSGLAIYSRSRWGRADMGVNRRRVERWLEEAEALDPQT